jgi:hypothetical protein
MDARMVCPSARRNRATRHLSGTGARCQSRQTAVHAAESPLVCAWKQLTLKLKTVKGIDGEA